MPRHFGPVETAGARRVTEAMKPLGEYADRQGYDPGFLGGPDPLPLPGAGQWEHDLVPLYDGVQSTSEDRTEIRYTHFSVKMSRSRKLPLFSAVNIEGAQSDRAVERTNVWRRDPRIDASVQVLREAYGDEGGGLFSRGHMTRREDPNWGSRSVAQTADSDTFHITNVAPQRQGFNAGIWLDLENYVLDNVDQENIRATVITGPVLDESDPVYYNVKVPVDFWKIVAFVHNVSGELTTIAYRRSQLKFLPRARRTSFVFGDFEDSQVSVASIELDTGLDLGIYKDYDVMAGADPSMAVRLSSVADLYLQR